MTTAGKRPISAPIPSAPDGVYDGGSSTTVGSPTFALITTRLIFALVHRSNGAKQTCRPPRETLPRTSNMTPRLHPGAGPRRSKCPTARIMNREYRRFQKASPRLIELAQPSERLAGRARRSVACCSQWPRRVLQRSNPQELANRLSETGMRCKSASVRRRRRDSNLQPVAGATCLHAQYQTATG